MLGAPPMVHAVARFLDRDLDRAEVRRGTESSEDRLRPAEAAGAGTELVDAGGGGDSGEHRLTAGKRPADQQPTGGRPAKRRPPATVTSAAAAEEPPPPEPGRLTPASEPEFDLNSAELVEQQREAERLLALELADRRLAEQLQRELNSVPPVDRSKGSADAYSLRGAAEGHPSSSGGGGSGAAARAGRKRPAAAGGRRQASSRRPAGRRDRTQLSIQESLSRSTRAASPEW